MSQALYRKWRPHLWNQVVGQDHVVRTIQNAIRSDRVGHAYLFAGPRGTGKTTTARLLAKAVNCLVENIEERPCDHCDNCSDVNENRFMDLIEIDAASNTSVDDIRDLREKINFSPSKGRKKIYIIDEVHMLSTAAFNALLKTLEEPPDHAIFILATTEIHKIPATVLSRCQRHEFRRIPINDITTHLSNLCSYENLDIDKESLNLIARQATGSLRDAISLLDQLSSTGENITLEKTENLLGTATNQMVLDLVDAILSRQASSGFEIIHQAIDSGNDPRQFGRQIVEYLRDVLIVSMGNADQIDATQDMRTQMAQHANHFGPEKLLKVIKAFNDAAGDGRSSWYPGLNLELAFAESLESISASASSSSASTSTNQNIETRSEIQPEIKTTYQKTAPVLQEMDNTSQTTEKVEIEKKSPEETNPDIDLISENAETDGAPQQSNEVDLNIVIKSWQRIRTLVKKHRGQTEGLLNSCKPLKLENGILYLGFASNVLKSKMEDGKNIELARQAINHILGSNIDIVCTVINNKAETNLMDLETDSDGMVNEALNLGGQLTHKE